MIESQLQKIKNLFDLTFLINSYIYFNYLVAAKKLSPTLIFGEEFFICFLFGKKPFY